MLFCLHCWQHTTHPLASSFSKSLCGSYLKCSAVQDLWTGYKHQVCDLVFQLWSCTVTKCDAACKLCKTDNQDPLSHGITWIISGKTIRHLNSIKFDWSGRAATDDTALRANSPVVETFDDDDKVCKQNTVERVYWIHSKLLLENNVVDLTELGTTKVPDTHRRDVVKLSS